MSFQSSSESRCLILSPAIRTGDRFHSRNWPTGLEDPEVLLLKRVRGKRAAFPAHEAPEGEPAAGSGEDETGKSSWTLQPRREERKPLTLTVALFFWLLEAKSE